MKIVGSIIAINGDPKSKTNTLIRLGKKLSCGAGVGVV